MQNIKNMNLCYLLPRNTMQLAISCTAHLYYEQFYYKNIIRGLSWQVKPFTINCGTPT